MIKYISTLPLFISYILFPIVFIVTRNSDILVSRNWIDIIWVLLVIISFLRVMINSNSTIRVGKLVFPITKDFFALIALLIFISIIRFGGALLFYDTFTIPFLMEVKPVFYFLFAVLWVGSFVKLNPEHFKQYGSYLGIILVLDFLLESILKGEIIRPRGSGEVNYDACLLLISFSMFFNNKNVCKHVLLTLIVIGLLATFSRTALITAAIMSFAFSKTGLFKKALFGFIFISFIFISFFLRDLPVDNVESMDRYWMWTSVMDLMLSHPQSLFWGFPPGVALPVDVPASLMWLWTSQQESWDISGIFPFHYHSFWIRVVLTWGIIPLLFILFFILFVTLSRKYSGSLRALTLLILIEGMTMGTFYLSNVAIPLVMALRVLYKEGKTDGLHNVILHKKICRGT